MSWQQQPKDQPPYGYEPPARQRSDMPAYNVAPLPQQYAPPQPVVVNVVQNAYGPRPVYARPRVNHWLHFWLTFLTGGLWAPIWIHQTRKSHRRAVYIR